MNKPTSNKGKKREVPEYRTASVVAYRKFIAENPGLSITSKEFASIIRTFNGELKEHVLQTGDRVKTSVFGSFSINKKKTRRFVETKDGKQYVILPVDWKKSHQLGKRVYHLNTHSDGYRYSWIWFRDDAKVRFADIWWFKPLRVSSRRITNYVMLGNDFCERYREWEKTSGPSRRRWKNVLL